MSQIDHNQIDGAMAEVISRAQNEKRVQQLDMVARRRSEESKRIDNIRQQGDLATKRVIISGVRNRSTVHKQALGAVPGVVPVNQAKPVVASSSENGSQVKFSHHRISDFKVPPKPARKGGPHNGAESATSFHTPQPEKPPIVTAEDPNVLTRQKPNKANHKSQRSAPVTTPPPPLPTNVENQSLNSSVGKLSDQYLVEQLKSPPAVKLEDSASEVNIEGSSADLILDQEFLKEPHPPSAWSEDPQESQEDPQAEAPPIPEEQPKHKAASQPLKNRRSKKNHPVEPSPEQASPQAGGHAEKINGGAHKIYGQKLPEEYLAKTSSRKKASNRKNQSFAKKRGFFFYLLILMIVIALVAWGIAGYLFFIY